MSPSSSPRLLMRLQIVVLALAAVLTACGTVPQKSLVGPTPDPSQVAAALRFAPTAILINHSAPTDQLFGAQFCGGVLVGQRTVLTAAHCVAHRSARGIDVVIGADNLCRTVAPVGGERIRVSAIATTDDSRLDMAVLTLTSGSATPPAPIAETAGTDRLIAVGWGRSSSLGPYPCRKQAKVLQRGEPTACRIAQQDNPTRWHPTQLCAVAAPSHQNTCIGDSGGPVLSTTPTGGFVVMATVNWGTGCEPLAPGFYTATAAISTWLRKAASGRDPGVASGPGR